MPKQNDPAAPRFRSAGPGDAAAIARLHADSWRRHYRGAFSDDFLDRDVEGYLRPVWAERLAVPDPHARTILAEHDGVVTGLAHTLLGEDPAWGALLDNLHVAYGLKGYLRGTRPGPGPGRRPGPAQRHADGPEVRLARPVRAVPPACVKITLCPP